MSWIQKFIYEGVVHEMRSKQRLILEGLQKVNEKRSSKIEKEMSDIGHVVGDLAGLESSKIEEILIDNNASEDDSGKEGFFSTMSDSDIHNAWVEIKDYIQYRVNLLHGDVDSQAMTLFGCKDTKFDKKAFLKKFHKMTGRNGFEDGYIEAVNDISTAYNLNIK